MKIRFYDNTALKFLRKQPPKQQQRLMDAIQRLPAGDVKVLKGMDSFCRLRVGSYRIIFVINYDRDEIVIRTIENRGDVYKNHP